MDSELRAKLKRQIQAYMEKKSCAELSEVTSWLKNDNDLLSGVQVNSKTNKSNGRPTISKAKQYQIKKLTLNKDNRSTREVGQRVGVSHMTVQRVLKKAGAKAYHKYKTQKLNENHKIRRFEFAKWMLRNFGSTRAAKRLDHMKQCPKFSDVWPIENIWGIIKERVAKKKCENLNQLKREITRVWRDLDADKSLHKVDP